MTLIGHFLATLPCPGCGQDTEVAIETRLLRDPAAMTVRIGDRTDIEIGHLPSRYFELRAPLPGEPLRLLEWYLCDACDSLNWALLVLRDGVFEALEPISLADGLAQAHFLTHDIEEPFERLTGQPFLVDGRPREGWQETLAAAARR
jgi:hypothetical protein